MSGGTSYRIFDAEAAVDGLARDFNRDEMDEREWQRVYMLREKIDKIIAGDAREVYENAWQKWYDDRGRELDNGKGT